MKVYYDQDADLNIIKNLNVTIVGYGSQGHAHAANLKDSGVNVTIGLRKDGTSWAKAENAGHAVKEVADSVKDAEDAVQKLTDQYIAKVESILKDKETDIMKV